MAEFNSAEKVKIDFAEGYSTDVMTGDRDKRMYLYDQLIRSLKKAERVDIIVSLLMESGVKILLGGLENALKRGAQIRILTGNYLGITFFLVVQIFAQLLWHTDCIRNPWNIC